MVKLAFHERHIGLSTIIVTQQLTTIAKGCLQDERLQGGILLHRSQGRSQGYFRKLPLRGKGRGEKNFRDVKERKVRPVGDPDGVSVHAESRDTLNFS